MYLRGSQPHSMEIVHKTRVHDEIWCLASFCMYNSVALLCWWCICTKQRWDSLEQSYMRILQVRARILFGNCLDYLWQFESGYWTKEELCKDWFMSNTAMSNISTTTASKALSWWSFPMARLLLTSSKRVLERLETPFATEVLPLQHYVNSQAMANLHPPALSYAVVDINRLEVRLPGWIVLTNKLRWKTLHACRVCTKRRFLFLNFALDA